MHWPSWTHGFENRLRLGLLAVAVAASVALPYLIIQRSAQRTLDASAWVVHSTEVKQSLYQLRFELADLESLVMASFVTLPQDASRDSYETVRDRIPPLLRALATATRDNPDQQNRIGGLEALVNGRLELFETAMTQIRLKNFDAASIAIRQAAQMFGSRDAAEQILAVEDALYAHRSESMESARFIARWTVVSALLAQLLLLGSVIFVSERQAYHRQSAEARARQAVERSRIIVQTLREPIVVLDASLHVLMANEAFREFYSPPADAADGGRLDQHGDGAWDNPLLLQRLLDVGARGREIWDFELSQCSADGIERIVLVNARRMELSEDKVAEHSILLTASDVTARKRYELRISELNTDLGAKVEQISEINRELESFSYSVSHDLRAPLRHIAGFADKLGAHIADVADDKSRHYLTVISDAARRMSTLIEDLLEYSRLGRSAVRTGQVDMNALVTEMRGMFEAGNAARDIKWRIGRLPMVLGDEAMLRRVWQNLISNAVKYTARREHAVIEIGADSSGSGEVIYYVRDNGTGFDMAYAGKLFGVFQRLHKAAEFPGTGIGLANVRRIIGRLGGRTWAEAEPDKGATIFFSLPTVVGAVSVQEVTHES